MTSHVTGTASLETTQIKEFTCMRNDDTSIVMIPVKSQNSEEVSAKPLKHLWRRANMCC